MWRKAMPPPKAQSRRYQILLAGLFICILAVITYYVGTVWRARIQTPEIVRSALASNRIELRLSDLSAWQKCALLAIQDPDFYEHLGVQRSFRQAFMHTTITQAIVKLLYFKPFKPGIRKIRQTLIARYALNPLASKDDQLILYINMVGFGTSPDGGLICGFGNAARAFFSKPLAELSEDEYLALVVMLDAPYNLNPQKHPRENAAEVVRYKSLAISKCASQKPSSL
jgi:membrane peptidoglycan carboxypeptidase